MLGQNIAHYRMLSGGMDVVYRAVYVFFHIT